LLAQAQAFVLPSQTEGISLTLLESMARGLPVVATRVGGNPEVVADGVTGLLVPAREPEPLAQAILHVLENPRQAQAMGRAGRQRVEENFDLSHMIARYEAMYRGKDVGDRPRNFARPLRSVGS
jgi:glycosyltransferase involved in cell wall biosynthesis